MSNGFFTPRTSSAGRWLCWHGRTRATRGVAAALLLWCGLIASGPLFAQVGVKPKSYSDYYREQRQQTHTGYMTPRQYTYNKYFYHNPAISPYSNLMRPASPYVPKYQTYVQPEIQRRSAAAQNYAPSPGSLQPRAPIGNQYHNKYYANNGQLPR